MSETQINTEHMTQWLAALRSGEFRQGTEALATITDPDASEHDLKNGAEFCCLGVAAYLCGAAIDLPRWGDGPMMVGGAVVFDDDSELAPGSVARWLGFPFHDTWGEDRVDFSIDWGDVGNMLTQDSGQTLRVGVGTVASLNDKGFTFSQIADLIDYFGICTDTVA